MRGFLFGLFACLAASGVTNFARANPDAGPSFDCKKASHEIELLICRDADLGALDHEVNATYVKAQGNLSGEQLKFLRTEQIGWIKGRNDCWKSDDKKKCASAETSRRIAILKTRYGLAEVGTPVYYSCGPKGETEIIFTPVATNPPGANLVRGDEAQTLILDGTLPGSRYAGDFWLTFLKSGTTATVTWPGESEVSCKQQ